MSMSSDDGQTHREQLANMALAEPMMMEVVMEDLVGPPLPPVASRAWDIFNQLSSTRSHGMGSVGAITYTELLAYQQLSGRRMTPLDVALVREADQAFISFAASHLKKSVDTSDEQNALEA